MLEVERKKGRILKIFILLYLLIFFPFCKCGLGGYFPDLMYHMLRIEGVRAALIAGEYPTRIYHFFYNGYGYGSPMFYPDIFLVVPALLRILGLTPIQAWKVFVAFLTIIISLSTYFSFRYISKNHEMAVAGTFLLSLSQFYLADIMNRVGISEYIAFIFTPILISGIYDFFVFEGKKTFLIGVGLLGLLLSHSIMAFLGVIVTSIIFVGMLFSRYRMAFFNFQKMKRLIISAIVTILLSAWYLFPMLEQMKAVEMNYKYPWAWIGNYVQPFATLFRMTGYFDSIAYVGIGIPILIILVLFGKNIIMDKKQLPLSREMILGGLILFVSTTKFVPWEKMNGTIFNMIQFTYRLYPYALILVCAGIVLHFSSVTYEKSRKIIVPVIIALCCAFAFLQNYTSYAVEPATYQIDDEFVNYNSNYAAQAEWLPTNVSGYVREGIATSNVVYAQGEIELDRSRYGRYIFDISESEIVDYTMPLIYYKGYRAKLITEAGEEIPLSVRKSSEDTVIVENHTGSIGKIEAWYKGTTLQYICNLLSIFTGIIVVIYSLICICRGKYIKKHKAGNN